MLCAKENRRRLLRDHGLQRHREADIAWLDDALGRLEAGLTTLIRSTPNMTESHELLRSVPGWDQSHRTRPLPICRNSATWIADALPPCPGWPRWPATAAPSSAGGSLSAVGRTSGASCT
jgi:hypothetical protein